MARQGRRHVPRFGLALTACLSAILSTTAFAAESQTAVSASTADIFNPVKAPVIKIKVTGKTH